MGEACTRLTDMRPLTLGEHVSPLLLRRSTLERAGNVCPSMRLELVGDVREAVRRTLIMSRPTDSHGTRSPLLDMYIYRVSFPDNPLS